MSSVTLRLSVFIIIVGGLVMASCTYYSHRGLLSRISKAAHRIRRARTVKIEVTTLQFAPSIKLCDNSRRGGLTMTKAFSQQAMMAARASAGNRLSHLTRGNPVGIIYGYRTLRKSSNFAKSVDEFGMDLACHNYGSASLSSMAKFKGSGKSRKSSLWHKAPFAPGHLQATTGRSL